jgi:hypothetical protein
MRFERSEKTMRISCREVWRDISDYIDKDLGPVEQAALDQHFAECRHCTALLAAHSSSGSWIMRSGNSRNFLSIGNFLAC